MQKTTLELAEQKGYSSTKMHQKYNEHQQQESILVTILSPRNILKFFTKNEQKVDTQIVKSPTNREYQEAKMPTSSQVSHQFGKYMESIGNEMQIYKNKRLKEREKLKNGQSKSKQRQKQKQQIKQQIKMNKIPQPYFRDWDKQVAFQQLDLQTSQILTQQQVDLQNIRETHKSLKLRSLLIISEGKGKQNKRSKFQRRLLEDKQTELEGYLDQVELLIFNRTRNYPEHYFQHIINLQNSDLQLSSISSRIKICRSLFRSQLEQVKYIQSKIINLEKKKKALSEVLSFLHFSKQIYLFKFQYENPSKSSGMPACMIRQKKSSNQLIQYIRVNSKIQMLSNLACLKHTISNIRQLDKAIKRKRLGVICTELKKGLQKQISSIYSRQAWLKQKPPKNSLLTERMKPEILQQMLLNQQNNLNSSHLNISVLDQSYYVASQNHSSKKQSNIFLGGSSKQVKQLIKQWSQYCRLYSLHNQKIDEEEEAIGQVFERIALKFNVKFDHDLEDYIAFIFAQNSIDTKQFPTLKSKLLYIQPKLYSKILKVLFQCLSTSLTFALVFKFLPSPCKKLLCIIEQKIAQMMHKKSLTDYDIIAQQFVRYDDVIEILSCLDYWFEYVANTTDQMQLCEQHTGDDRSETIANFEQSLLKLKQKMADEHLAHIHKFALVSSIKQSIEKEDFCIISIPVSAFSLLDFIINWGQNLQADAFGLGKLNEVEQSFYLNSSFMNEGKKSQSFSIFKIIDKKLIIQGKQYKLCNSLLMLAWYLQVYLKSKQDFKELTPNIDQRICEVVGFYIWYCKKAIFSVNQQSSTHLGQNSKGSSSSKPISTSLGKKSIISLCMLGNICDLLIKFMDIFNLANKPKKVEKVLSDLSTIRADCFKQIKMLPFLQVERQISCLYESRLKTRKEVPTKQSIRIIEVVDHARKDLSQFVVECEVKKLLESTMKIISKNYFGYLHNMEARGISELKWFLQRLKDIVGDLFPTDISNLQKLVRF